MKINDLLSPVCQEYYWGTRRKDELRDRNDQNMIAREFPFLTHFP